MQNERQRSFLQNTVVFVYYRKIAEHLLRQFCFPVAVQLDVNFMLIHSRFANSHLILFYSSHFVLGFISFRSTILYLIVLNQMWPLFVSDWSFLWWRLFGKANLIKLDLKFFLGCVIGGRFEAKEEHAGMGYQSTRRKGGRGVCTGKLLSFFPKRFRSELHRKNQGSNPTCNAWHLGIVLIDLGNGSIESDGCWTKSNSILFAILKFEYRKPTELSLNVTLLTYGLISNLAEEENWDGASASGAVDRVGMLCSSEKQKWCITYSVEHF